MNSSNFFTKPLVFIYIIVLISFLSSCVPDKSEVKQIPPQYAESVSRHSNLGIAYMERAEYKEAAEEFKNAVETFDDYVAGHVNLGLAYYYQRDYEDAQKEFSRVLELDPGNAHALFNLGLLSNFRGEYQQAMEYLNKVKEIDAEDPFVLYNLGIALSRLKKSDEAVQQFERALALDPNNASVHYSLGRELVRLGSYEQANKELETFQKLQGGYIASKNLDLTYQEQGKYGMAMEVREGTFEQEKQKQAVKFVDVTDESGLFTNAVEMPSRDAYQLVSGIEIEALAYDSSYVRNKLVPMLGSGGAFADYDGDGYLDIYIVRCSPEKENSGNILYRNKGDGTFTNVTDVAGVGDAGMGMGCTFGDYDNDGDLDLYVTNFGPNVLYENDGDGTFTDVTERAGVENSNWSLGAAFADFDHDSHLDLYVTNFVDVNNVPKKSTFLFPQDFLGSSNVLYQNMGDSLRTFVNSTEHAGVGDGNHKSLSVVFTDFDEDKDIDLYLVNYGATNSLFSNQRDGTFKNETRAGKEIHDESSVAVSTGDFDGDGYIDLLLANWDKECFALYLNTGNGKYSKNEAFSEFIAKRDSHIGWNAGFIDYDNDGHLDIFTIDNEGYALTRNGSNGFIDVTDETGMDRVSREFGRGASFGDYDNDGDVDILVINNGGFPVLLRNDGGDQNNWLKVSAIGGESSNKSGIGVKVEVKAGNLWQKQESKASSGYLSDSSHQSNFGLAGHKRADLVRVIWPSGIRQAQANVPANQVIEFIEVGKKASCPLLFVWDGSRYQFVTDILGAGFIGLWLEPDKYFIPDPTEYIKIEGNLIKPKESKYSLRLVELMEEVDYLDEVKLFVIDHFGDTEVYPNERLLMTPPWPEYRLHMVRGAKVPASAVDDWGKDILPLISRRDKNYPSNFRLLPYIGYAETHSIILDLGDLSQAQKILLIMHGWIDYWNSTGNFFAHRDGVPFIAPYLQVLDENGNWTTVAEDMGYPAGMPKIMTLDLTGKFLTNTYKVKITTNLRIYWDQILVSTFAEEVPLRTTTLEPTIAQLQWKGYPKYYSADGLEPLTYDYHTAAATVPWEDQPGFYTRYGDVRELLKQTDDKFAIMRHGDEVSLEFDVASLPKISKGWTRDFLLFVDGFVKEKDSYTAFSSTVEPLPFHGMSNYPYKEDENYPADKNHNRYLEKYNTRIVRKPGLSGQMYSKKNK